RVSIVCGLQVGVEQASQPHNEVRRAAAPTRPAALLLFRSDTESAAPSTSPACDRPFGFSRPCETRPPPQHRSGSSASMLCIPSNLPTGQLHCERLVVSWLPSPRAIT